MNLKKIFIGLFVLLCTFSLVLTGCKKKNKEEKFEPVELETILTTYKNNDAVKVEGVVYGVTSNGFYVADSELGRAFVIMGSTWEANVKIGDKVQVSGAFGYVSNFPQIKSVTNVKVVSSDNASLISTTTATDLTAISSLKTTDRTGSYGKLVKVIATVGKNKANIYTLTDDNGVVIYVSNNSNVEELAKWNEKRVAINVIAYNFSSTDNKWVVDFVENSIEDAAIPFEQLVTAAKADIEERLVKEIYGKLNLPKSNQKYSYLTYTWSSNSEFITIDNNKASVKLDDANQEVELTVEISDGTNKETAKYVVTSYAIVERALSEVEDIKIDESYVIVRAIVMAISRNQSLNLRSLIVKDMNSTYTNTIDFSDKDDEGIITLKDEAFTNVKVGDEILVKGQYRVESRKCVNKVTSIEIISNNNEVNHDLEGAYVLKDEASYQEFGKNYDKYINKLVKIENPFMRYSTSSAPADTNWVQLGHDAVNNKYGETGSQRSFAFLIAAQNENLGGANWRNYFDIPLFIDSPKQFGLTIYAYALYISDSYIQFIIPSIDYYQMSANDKVAFDLSYDIPENIEYGKLDLKLAHELVTGAITWESDNTAVIANDGTITEVAENTTVKLTAKYTIGETEYTKEYTINVLKSTPMKVSELLANGVDGKLAKVQGIIVAFSSDGNETSANGKARQGYILMDETTHEMVQVNGMLAIGGEYGAYTDSDGNVLKIGDEIVLYGTYTLNTEAIGSGPEQVGRKCLTVSGSNKVTRTRENVAFTWGDAAVTITNSEEFDEFAKNLQYSVLIKLVGTKENPIYLGGSASTLPINIKIHMNGAATDNAGTKYNGYTFALKSSTQGVNAENDNEWYRRFGIEGAFVASASADCIELVGDLYLVVCANTSTYYQCAIVNLDNTTATEYVAPEKVGEKIIKGLPSTLTSGALNAAITLPTTHPLVNGNITWTSKNSEIIDITNGKIAYVDEDTKVVLNASYKVGEQDFNIDFEVTVSKSITKEEVETALFKGFINEVVAGTLPFTLPLELEGIGEVSWASDNDAINLDTLTVTSGNSSVNVTLTATYSFRGTETTSTYVVKVKSGIELSDIQALILKDLVTSVYCGNTYKVSQLPTTNEIVGDIVWTSSNEELLPIATGKTTFIDVDTKVNLIASFTFDGEAATATLEVTVKDPMIPAEALSLTEKTNNLTLKGQIVSYISDGNSKATRMGVLLMDPSTKDLIMVSGLSNAGGSYGAYKDSYDVDLTIGDEIVVTGNMYVTSLSADSFITSLDNEGRKVFYVSSSDQTKRLSTGKTVELGAPTVVITNDTELKAFAANPQYGVIIKITGDVNNIIGIGGSSSSSPCKYKIYMNNAIDNNATKYSGATFALAQDANAPMFGGDNDWAMTVLGVASSTFVAPKSPNFGYNATGDMYVILSFKTSTYWQLNAINTSAWTITSSSRAE